MEHLGLLATGCGVFAPPQWQARPFLSISPSAQTTYTSSSAIRIRNRFLAFSVPDVPRPIVLHSVPDALPALRFRFLTRMALSNSCICSPGANLRLTPGGD